MEILTWPTFRQTGVYHPVKILPLFLTLAGELL